MRPEAYFDIGGTYIRAEVVEKGRILFYKKLRTPKKLSDFAGRLGKLISLVCLKYNCRKVNFGVAGVINGSKIVSSHNINKYLRNFDLKKMVPPAVELAVDNDARGWLKRLLRADRSLRSGVVLGITIGTGVGRALAKDGRVLKIKKFEQAEKWERAYQVRRFQPTVEFGRWFSDRLRPIIRRYRPCRIVFSGGVIERKKGLARVLRAQFEESTFFC